MKTMTVKALIALVLCLALSVAVFAANRDKDERPATKATVTQKQTTASKTTVTSITPVKTTPTETNTPAVQPTSPTTEPAAATPRAGEEINWQVIASGGGTSTLGSMILASTVGQTVAGQSTIGDMVLNSGFQQNFEEGGGCCIPPIRGDVNYDGAELIDISDLVWLIDYMFLSGPPPACFDEADLDASGSAPLDISDLVLLMDYMFTGGAEPPACP